MKKLQTLIENGLNDQTIQAQIQADPKAFLQEAKTLADNPSTDPRAYMLVIWILGVITVIAFLTGILGYLFPGLGAKEGIPQFIVAMGSTALGALAGLLAPNNPGGD